MPVGIAKDETYLHLSPLSYSRDNLKLLAHRRVGQRHAVGRLDRPSTQGGHIPQGSGFKVAATLFKIRTLDRTAPVKGVHTYKTHLCACMIVSNRQYGMIKLPRDSFTYV